MYDSKRDSEGRARLLSTLIPSGATVLDFGTHRGFIARRLVEHGCQVTAVAPEVNVDGAVCIRRTLTPGGIGRLGTFEFVLALSVLHHCVPWRSYADALLSAATETLFVETPGPDEHVPQQPGLYEWASKFGTVGSFPGFREGHVRDIVAIPCG